MIDKVNQVFSEAFHKHITECKQCEENPFDLCQTGRILIKCAVPQCEIGDSK